MYLCNVSSDTCQQTVAVKGGTLHFGKACIKRLALDALESSKFHNPVKTRQRWMSVGICFTHTPSLACPEGQVSQWE